MVSLASNGQTHSSMQNMKQKSFVLLKLFWETAIQKKIPIFMKQESLFCNAAGFWDCNCQKELFEFFFSFFRDVFEIIIVTIQK